MVDADRLLELTERLHEAHARIDDSSLPPEHRSRWQRRLIAITETAHRDLERAELQLLRFDHELDRHLGRG